jgi:succinate dehydrogenase / fumarate reductase, iron-sulfur subunit
MKADLKVRRYSPEIDKQGAPPRWQEYTVDIHPDSTVLDALIQVREEQDGTLAIRCSCRASICGSCGMRVNGRARLVCKTQVRAVAPKGERIVIEPMGNQPVIKDLAVDLTTFFGQMKRITPFMQPEKTPEKGEFIASYDSMNHLVSVMNCIMCGVCVSDCTVLEVDKKFIGPAALAKAYRFVADPRDDKHSDRLKFLNNEHGGIWDCTRCNMCVEVCPKGVAPMDRIMAMRDMAIEAGNRSTTGYKHTDSFERSVRKNGRLDELRIAVESPGLFNIPAQLAQAPLGVKAFLKGKMPPVRPHKAEEHKNITKVFERVEAGRKGKPPEKS